MTGAGFETRFERLPESLPVFPLRSILLLPRALYRIRIEIAFEGGQALNVFVLPAVADDR